MWQYETGAGSDRATGYRDLLNKIVALATSKHVATVTPNGVGTGYVVGDIVTLTHAGAYLDAKFEVTTIGGSGEITGLEIRANGAFGNRAASATVSAGGTGYAVGNVLQVQGGTYRERAKFTVATLGGGSDVATVSLFETGGHYTSTPSNPASTTKVGPAAGSGTGCTLTVTYTGLIGTSGLALSGGTGTGETVDITLADSGWTEQRNVNNITHNSVTDEKIVVLKGDATGKTNKPYIGFHTWTETSGLNTRYGISLFGMVAHNAGIGFHQSPGISPGINTTTGALADGGGNILCDENDAQDMDFWLSVTDSRLLGVLNINSGAANTDDGEYMHFHLGYLDAAGTEVEDPYPMMVGASGRAKNLDPSASSQSISGINECIGPTGSTPGWHWYRADDASWQAIENSENLNTNQERAHIMYPMGQISRIDGTANEITFTGPVNFWTGIGSTGRAAPTKSLCQIPGSTPLHFLIPLVLCSRPGGTSLDETLDSVRGNVHGAAWANATDDAGAQIANFSEDYVTISGTRHYVFHNHLHTERYQYVAIEETT